MSVLIDAHVHFQPGFRVDAFLDGAHRNRIAAARELALDEATPCVLLLADPDGWNSFPRLRDGLRDRAPSTWRLEPTGEKESHLARRVDGPELVLVRGRQIATRERLEILALASDPAVPDDAPFAEALTRCLAERVLTVVPWGFGKWTGRRARLVERAMETDAGGRFFLGDNGNRPARTRTPVLLRRAAELGIPNLPGTDPLPLRSHERRACGRGFVLDGDLDADRPARVLVERVHGLVSQPGTFGSGSGWLDFVASQLRIRLRRRNVHPDDRHAQGTGSPRP